MGNNTDKGRFRTNWIRVAIALACMAGLMLPSMLASGQDDIGRKRNHGVVRPTIPDANRNVTDKVFLEHADTWRYEEQRDVEAEFQYQVLSGNVVFRKGGMWMYCDSAYFYDNSNSFDAFSNVRMEQGDTLFVYADELNYDGQTELAVLYADYGKKVRLINQDVQLATDVFNYDMAQEVGYYEVGGVLTDKENRLESLEGEYHPDTKYAYFYKNVRLTSLNNTDTMRMYTDSLVYNTATHVAELVSPTQIVSVDGTIYSSSGEYNTESGLADLYRRSSVVTRRGNTLTGDTLFYDRDRGIGEAFGNMVLTDSARQSSLYGDYGYYNDGADSAFVTGRALGKEYSKGDTLYMHGDTITAYVDHVDSMRITNVYHKVRFYRSDLAGLCDSLSFSERDSIMYLYRHPVVWSDERQIFGNVIYVHLNDSAADWARLPDFGFMAEHIGEDCFNQLSGTDMTVWFNDSTLRRMYVEGNVQMIVFPMEADSTYNKYFSVESSFMDAYFKDNAIESIHLWPETPGTVNPLYLAKRSSYFLPKFQWYDDMRPRTPAEVFIRPQSMIDLLDSAVTTTKKASRAAARAASPDRPGAPISRSDSLSVEDVALPPEKIAGDDTSDEVSDTETDTGDEEKE